MILSVKRLAHQNPTYASLSLSLDNPVKIVSCPQPAHLGSSGTPTQQLQGAVMITSLPYLPFYGCERSLTEGGKDLSMASCCPQVDHRVRNVYIPLPKADGGAELAKFNKEAGGEEESSDELDDDEAENIYANPDDVEEEEDVKGVFPSEEVEYVNTITSFPSDSGR